MNSTPILFKNSDASFSDCMSEPPPNCFARYFLKCLPFASRLLVHVSLLVHGVEGKKTDRKLDFPISFQNVRRVELWE